MKTFKDKPFDQWLTEFPALQDVKNLQPSFWFNPHVKTFDMIRNSLDCSYADVKDAADRLERFKPYIASQFPETQENGGEIESPMQAIPEMQKTIADQYNVSVPGSLLVKLDSHLPISGSIKARGGIYEILKYAETIAIRNGLLKTTDNYSVLAEEKFRKVFSTYSIGVGSTGNLGLSIGIVSARLGFRVAVHMSSDAKEWKKKMLRSKGVTVVEYDADYSVAVAEGRRQAATDPRCHFVDDEDSRDLFLGYAVAAERLKEQFQQQGVMVDAEHPLFVYLPCGVGGGPGGVTFGLKLAFGDHVRCFFVEPTQSPALLTGLVTGLHDRVSACEFGVENKTIADGLAVCRPSGLVCRMVQNILSGIFTTSDKEMYNLLVLLAQSEGLRLEPSAVAGFSGYARLNKYLEQNTIPGRTQADSTHLVWATGGSMVPENVWQEYYDKGIQLSGG
ncbi:D-serine ammonia-lyase [Desulfopila sp. IMCC35008]|uniref:D-serine ammonia-lyase n=1 Tax=Desulfopila sp. IMCC35008 TaxID=2653858 RepID=UPI0013D750F4|nr:D-serine ammonia-lyase [Desulfopila sp. IMCC35008]